MLDGDRSEQPLLSKAVSQTGDVAGVGIKAMNEKAFARAKCGRKLAVARTEMHDEAALHSRLVQQLLAGDR